MKQLAHLLDNIEKSTVLYTRILDSESYEVQKLADGIFDQIESLDDPYPVLEKIEEVFILNSLPHTGKLFRVFEFLYSDTKILDKISEHSSPELIRLKHSGNVNQIRYLFFKDLLKTHILS